MPVVSDRIVIVRQMSWDEDALLWVPTPLAVATAGLTDTELRATPIPVDAQINTVGLATSALQVAVARTASAPAAASVGVASAQAVASQATRKGLVLVNTSVNTISLGIGAAAVLNSGITLLPNGGTWNMDEWSFATGAVNAIAGGAASNLAVQEYLT